MSVAEHPVSRHARASLAPFERRICTIAYVKPLYPMPVPMSRGGAVETRSGSGVSGTEIIACALWFSGFVVHVLRYLKSLFHEVKLALQHLHSCTSRSIDVTGAVNITDEVSKVWFV